MSKSILMVVGIIAVFLFGVLCAAALYQGYTCDQPGKKEAIVSCD